LLGIKIKNAGRDSYPVGKNLCPRYQRTVQSVTRVWQVVRRAANRGRRK